MGSGGRSQCDLPAIKFRNFTAAARKPLLVPFGFYVSDGGGPAGVDHIEDAENTVRVTITGVQNGLNTIFGLSLAPTFARLYRNGIILNEVSDYGITSNVLTMVVPPAASDILLLYDYPALFLNSSGGGGGGGGTATPPGCSHGTTAAPTKVSTPCGMMGPPRDLR